jgi:hypothetical protein
MNSATTDVAALASALTYAARGWLVLPVQPNGKAPLGALASRGLHDATTDAVTIRRWWTEAQDANVGIGTGAASGLVVLDVDPRHGGDRALAELEQKYGSLPATIRARTGGGGAHAFFSYPIAPGGVRNAVGIGGHAGLDLRGDGGYIVAPPSRHASGGQYRWEPGCGPDEIRLAQMPTWLLALVQRRPSAASSLHAEDAIADGTRSSTLTSLAGTMRRRGMTTDAITAALLTENARRCVPPLPEEEVKRIAASVGRYDAPAASSPAMARRTRAGDLVALVDAELFHTTDGEPFATFTVGHHRETWPLKSKGFRRWLSRRFYEHTGAVPGDQALQAAIAVLEGRAVWDGAQHTVFVRVARHEDAVYIDLANDAWNVVRITPGGWEIVSDPPIKFRRSRGTGALPLAASGGRLDALRPFINVATETDWKLVVSWLVGAFNPIGPYPLLALHGEQGSAKSTTARVLRSLIDPNTSPLRTEPRDVRDLMIAANNSWVLALDNLSSIAPWLSDALCRVSSGGGYATRELHTDTDEVLFDVQRPIILTGIADVASRSDLLDRVIILELPAIPDARRQTESEFWRIFDEARPLLLGALCDAVAAALRNRTAVTLGALPRMADFAVWVTAAEPTLGWSRGRFLVAYIGNRAEAHDVALDASPVAGEVRALLAEYGNWMGTAGDLLRTLSDRADAALLRQRTWPSTPRALAGALRRLASNLRAIGIAIEFSREPGGSRRRLVTLRAQAAATVSTVPIVSSVSASCGEADVSTDLDRRPVSRDGRDDESRLCLEGDRTSEDGEQHSNGALEPSVDGREAEIFWPERIAGLGQRRVDAYSPCAQCGTGTWARYGDRALCRRCARQTASLTPANVGDGEGPRDPQGRHD